MEDFLGNTYKAGDQVLYAAMSDRSANMVLAKVVEIKENGNVVVEPVKSARWKQHHGRTRYTDTRTGKTFDPYGPKAEQHLARKSHYYDKRTGEELDRSRLNSRIYSDVQPFGWQPNPHYVPGDFVGWKNDEWKDYVKVENVTSKVTLTVTENIVKWDGPRATAN